MVCIQEVAGSIPVGSTFRNPLTAVVSGLFRRRRWSFPGDGVWAADRRLKHALLAFGRARRFLPYFVLGWLA
jgi:hypothetical protein